MARKSAFHSLPEESQKGITELVEVLEYYPTLLHPPQIVDVEMHEEYLKKIEEGADPETTIDMGVIQRTNTQAVSALIEKLEEIKDEAKLADSYFRGAEPDKSVSKDISFNEEHDVKVGDVVTFKITKGKKSKEYTRPIVKLTATTFQVEFDDEYQCDITPDKPTGIKRIKYEALLNNKTKYAEDIRDKMVNVLENMLDVKAA